MKKQIARKKAQEKIESKKPLIAGFGEDLKTNPAKII